MIADRYTLQREIGRGGMGAVWLARDEVLGRLVALKRVGVVPGGGTPDLERAEREARLAARLNHPHVVAVFDLVTEGDQQWLVMEYVEGSTLAGLVRRDGALTPDQAAPLIGQAADALAAAHAAGIVHRDVKPSNMLVTPEGQVKLSDFGIARAEADASLTQTGLVTGSPAYLAPEVASGQPATDASDVWSLGATLFHALAGHPPYEVGDNVLGALYRIVHEEPPQLPGAGWLKPLLRSTMTREPEDRWSMIDVGDFLAAGPAAPRSARTTVAVAEPTPSHTQVLPAVVPPAPQAPPPRPGAPTVPAGRSGGRGRGRLLALLAVAAVVVLAAVVGGLVLTDEDGAEQGRPGAATGRPGGQSGQPETTAPETTAPETGSDGPTAEGMKSFVESYLATVTNDPAATWEQLTPAFQEQSGNFGQYKKFWSGFQTADITAIEADPETLTVSYSVEYVDQGGNKVGDDVTLELTYEDGSFRIAAER